MQPTPAIEFRPRSVGELLDLTFHLYRRHFVPLIGLTLIVMGPYLALNLLSSTGSLVQYAASLGSTMRDDGAATTGAATALALLVSTCAGGLALLAGIFVPWMDGALTFSVIERVLDRQPAWRESYRATQPRWGSLWVANAIRTVVMGLALVPLIGGLYGALFAGVFGWATLSDSSSSVDGGLFTAGLLAICLPIVLLGGALAIFIGVNWSMAVPAIVGEGAGGTDALRRSNALTRGMRWRLLGRLLLFEVMRFFVITLPVMALQVFVFGASALAFDGGDLSPLALLALVASTLFGTLTTVLVVPLYAIYLTANYFDLRIRKENLDLQLKVARFAPELPATAQAPVTAATAITGDLTDRPALVEAPAAPVDLATLTPAQRISVLFRRLRTEGENAELLNELGLAYQAVGDQYGALDAFTRARTLAPADPDTAYNLALLLRDRRDLAAARRVMAEYMQLETSPVERQKVLDNPGLKDLLP